MASYQFNLEGGIERASSEVALRLSERGHDVTLVAHAVSEALPNNDRGGPRRQKVPMPSHPPQMVPLLFSRAATKALDYDAFDIVHNQGGCALRRQDVITAHSCHRAWWEMKRVNGEKVRAYLNPHHHAILRVERENYRPGSFHRVIAVSAGVKAEIVRHYGVPEDLITVVPNGVDVLRFDPPDREAVRYRLRTELGLGDNVVLLFVGKEFRRKGLQIAIEALAKLPGNVRLLVVGGDRREPFLKVARSLGAASRVIFAGHQSRVEDYFQAADIFVFPTVYEAFALVTLEAAASGLPIVSTKVNGTEDFIQSGVNGYFAQRDSDSFAHALTGLVTDPALRKELSDGARATARAYSWERVAEETLDVYGQVALLKGRHP